MSRIIFKYAEKWVNLFTSERVATLGLGGMFIGGTIPVAIGAKQSDRFPFEPVDVVMGMVSCGVLTPFVAFTSPIIISSVGTGYVIHNLFS